MDSLRFGCAVMQVRRLCALGLRCTDCSGKFMLGIEMMITATSNCCHIPAMQRELRALRN